MAEEQEQKEQEQKGREILVIASKVKDVVKNAGMQSSGDLVEAVSEKVHDMLQAAMARAKANGGRQTVRPYDL